MTRKIETAFPRTFLLENVALLRATSLEPDEVRRGAISLSRFIRRNGGSPVGPLIQRVEPPTEAVVPAQPGTTLMRQSSSTLEAPAGVGAEHVEVDDRIEVRNCVLARFRGDASDIDVVYSSLGVFAYENELVLDGTVYLVFAGEDGMTITVDAFAPVSEPRRHANG